MSVRSFWRRFHSVRWLGLRLVLGLATFALSFPVVMGVCVRAEDGEAEAADYFAQFSASWRDDAWIQRRGRRGGYMRADEDRGWQLRMRALQGLVAGGEKSIAPLVKTLGESKPHVRILAAQSLGYLGKNVPAEPLLKALESDPVPAVRLYAADALGMIGEAARLAEAMRKIQKTERNGDVRRHISYALERKGKRVDGEIVARLAKWDASEMDQAEIGKPAPDFELADLTGKKIKLSDFHGKRPVVLVFIYGDT